MLCSFMLLFNITPGFGKLNLERYNTNINAGMTTLTDGKFRIFRQDNYGFDLNCPHTMSTDAEMYAHDYSGFVSTEFIE